MMGKRQMCGSANVAVGKKQISLWRTGFLRVFCSKIPWLFQSRKDNFSDFVETKNLSHKCQKWYIIS